MQPCPICRKQAEQWWEQPKFGSRELYWIGCRADGQLVGGITEGIARGRWLSLVTRLLFERSQTVR